MVWYAHVEILKMQVQREKKRKSKLKALTTRRGRGMQSFYKKPVLVYMVCSWQLKNRWLLNLYLQNVYKCESPKLICFNDFLIFFFLDFFSTHREMYSLVAQTWESQKLDSRVSTLEWQYENLDTQAYSVLSGIQFSYDWFIDESSPVMTLSLFPWSVCTPV